MSVSVEPEVDCAAEPGYEECMSCCKFQHMLDQTPCLGICLSKIDPSRGIYPGPEIGPWTPEQKVCGKACSANGRTAGVVVCYSGAPLACVCTNTPLRGGSDSPSSIASCIAQHELINAGIYDCSGVADGESPTKLRPGVKQGRAVCNESEAWSASAACAAMASCDDRSGKARCMCEASKAGLAAEWSCNAAFYAGNCNRSPPRDPDRGEEYSAMLDCVEQGKTIRQAAAANCR